jgi:uncharacterized protein (UPF0332 family)
VKPVEFKEVAELLIASSGGLLEARRRSAVSRWYYAAFLEARDQLAVKRQISYKRHQSHENVKKSYARADAPEKDVKVVGRLLEDLKRLREDSDYEIAEVVDETAVAEAKAMCEEIRSKLNDPNFNYAACKDARYE